MDLIYHGFIPLRRWRSILRRTATYRFAKGRTPCRRSTRRWKPPNSMPPSRRSKPRSPRSRPRAWRSTWPAASRRPPRWTSRPMLDILNADADLHDGNVDCSNYGCFEGIPSARKLAGEFLGCPAEQTLVLGSSSLLIEHDIAGMFWRCGSCGSEPWDATRPRTTARRSSSCALFPATTVTLASPPTWVSENVPVAMTDNGPDMDEGRAPGCRRRLHQGHLVRAQVFQPHGHHL